LQFPSDAKELWKALNALEVFDALKSDVFNANAISTMVLFTALRVVDI
jgi:hypothetical protein